MDELKLPFEIEDRYELKGQLGAGGMGSVFRAYDKQMGRDVALKVILPELMDVKEVKKRFKREVQVLAKVQHANVIKLFDYYEGGPGASQVYTMEFIKGDSLHELRQCGPLKPARALKLFRQLADGLAATHELSILHRDIKARNIVLTEDDIPIIIDFGLSRPDSSAVFTKLTKTGALVGTMAYLPPEVFANQDFDSLCDVYQLGLVFYEVLTGTFPFEDAKIDDIVFGKTLEKLAAPSEVIDLPDEYLFLDELIKRTIGPRDERPQARELCQLLDSRMKGQSPTRETKPRSRKRSDQVEAKWRKSIAYLFPILSLCTLLIIAFLVFTANSEPKEVNPFARLHQNAKTLGLDKGTSDWYPYAQLLARFAATKSALAYQSNEAVSELTACFGKNSPAAMAVAALAFTRDGKNRLAASAWGKALEEQNKFWAGNENANLALLFRLSWFTKEALLCKGISNEKKYVLLHELRKKQFKLKGSALRSKELHCSQMTAFLGWAYLAAKTKKQKALADMQPALSLVHLLPNTPRPIENLLKELWAALNKTAKANGLSLHLNSPLMPVKRDHWYEKTVALTAKADDVGNEIEFMFKDIKDMLNWRAKRDKLLNDNYLRTTRQAAWTNWMGFNHFPSHSPFAQEAVRTFCDIHNFHILEDMLPGRNQIFKERWGKELEYGAVIELTCQVIHSLLEQLSKEEQLEKRVELESILHFVVTKSLWTSPHDYTAFAAKLDPLVAKPALRKTIFEAFYRGRRAFSANQPDLAVKNFARAWRRLVAVEEIIEKDVAKAADRKRMRTSLSTIYPFLERWFYAIKASKNPKSRLEVTKKVLDYIAQYPGEIETELLRFKNAATLHLVDSAMRFGDDYVKENAKRLLQPVKSSTHPLQKNFAFDLLKGKTLPQIDDNTRTHPPMSY